MATPVKDAWFVRSWGGLGMAPISDIGWAVIIVFIGMPFVVVSLVGELHASQAEKGLLAGLWFFAFWIVARHKSCTQEEYEEARRDAKVTRRTWDKV